MWVSIVSWNGTAINNGSPYDTSIEVGELSNLSRGVVLVDRANDYPFLTSAPERGSTIAIQVKIHDEISINTYREPLKQLFFGDNLKHNLIVIDKSDSNRQYYRTGIPIRFVQVNDKTPNAFIIIIQTDVPYWTTVSTVTDPWSITASGQTHAVTNIGTRPVKPVFTFTPTTTKAGGLLYRRWLSIRNNMDVTYKDSLDVTNGGLDTAALTTAKMQADGDDFRNWRSGGFIDRWLQSMDTSATKLWSNWQFQPRHFATLLTSLGSSDSTETIALTQTQDSLDFLKYLNKASNRVLQIQNEAFTYSDSDIDYANFKITSCPRAQKDTTAATHTAPQTVHHIEFDSWLLYGDSSMAAQDVNDSNKPIFELSSTNLSRVFANFFDKNNPNRPLSWKGEINRSRTQLSYFYTGDRNTFEDVSTELGLALIGGENAPNIIPETGQIDWIWSHPAGITGDIPYSGEKYVVSSWPAIVGLQYLQNGVSWFTASNESSPIAPFTWEAFGNTATLPDTFFAIRFSMDGGLDAVVDEKALVQFDEVTIPLDSDNIPSFYLGVETAMNFFDVKFTNNTSGEWIRFQAPVLVNQTVTIDCEKKIAYVSDGSPVIVTQSTDRESWLDLASGSSTLKFEDVGTVAVTQQTSYYAKVL